MNITPTPTPEELDFQIYEYGYDKALERNNLTEKEALKILYDKKYIRKNKLVNKSYLDDDKHQMKVTLDKTYLKNITDFYNRMRKKNYNNVIDNTAQSNEDYFQNQILKIMEKHLIVTDIQFYFSLGNQKRDSYKKKNKQLNYNNFAKSEYNEKLFELINKYR